jgi:hypothetical protein
MCSRTFWDTVLQCIPSWPQTCDPFDLATWMPRLQVCAAMPPSEFILNMYKLFVFFGYLYMTLFPWTLASQRQTLSWICLKNLEGGGIFFNVFIPLKSIYVYEEFLYWNYQNIPYCKYFCLRSLICTYCILQLFLKYIWLF